MCKGREFNKYTHLAISLVMMVGISTYVFAACPSNKQTIDVTKVTEQKWKKLKDDYSDPKQYIVFHDKKGGLIKLPPGYKNPPHHYENDVSGIVISGDLSLVVNGKTITLGQGDYFTVPGRVCFVSFSRHGAIIALLGHTPGSYEKAS